MSTKHNWQMNAVNKIAEDEYNKYLQTELDKLSTIDEKMDWLEQEREAIRIERSELKAAKKEGRDPDPKKLRK